jgi:hypothetical protein
MNQDIFDLDGDDARASYQRRNAHQRDVVDLGIALQQRSNTMSAVEYLRSQDIGHDVIERVLTEPGRRRSWAG